MTVNGWPKIVFNQFDGQLYELGPAGYTRKSGQKTPEEMERGDVYVWRGPRDMKHPVNWDGTEFFDDENKSYFHKFSAARDMGVKLDVADSDSLGSDDESWDDLFKESIFTLPKPKTPPATSTAAKVTKAFADDADNLMQFPLGELPDEDQTQPPPSSQPKKPVQPASSQKPATGTVVLPDAPQIAARPAAAAAAAAAPQYIVIDDDDDKGKSAPPEYDGPVPAPISTPLVVDKLNGVGEEIDAVNKVLEAYNRNVRSGVRPGEGYLYLKNGPWISYGDIWRLFRSLGPNNSVEWADDSIVDIFLTMICNRSQTLANAHSLAGHRNLDLPLMQVVTLLEWEALVRNRGEYDNSRRLLDQCIILKEGDPNQIVLFPVCGRAERHFWLYAWQPIKQNRFYIYDSLLSEVARQRRIDYFVKEIAPYVSMRNEDHSKPDKECWTIARRVNSHVASDGGYFGEWEPIVVTEPNLHAGYHQSDQNSCGYMVCWFAYILSMGGLKLGNDTIKGEINYRTDFKRFLRTMAISFGLGFCPKMPRAFLNETSFSLPGPPAPPSAPAHPDGDSSTQPPPSKMRKRITPTVVTPTKEEKPTTSFDYAKERAEYEAKVLKPAMEKKLADAGTIYEFDDDGAPMIADGVTEEDALQFMRFKNALRREYNLRLLKWESEHQPDPKIRAHAAESLRTQMQAYGIKDFSELDDTAEDKSTAAAASKTVMRDDDDDDDADIVYPSPPASTTAAPKTVMHDDNDIVYPAAAAAAAAAPMTAKQAVWKNADVFSDTALSPIFLANEQKTQASLPGERTNIDPRVPPRQVMRPPLQSDPITHHSKNKVNQTQITRGYHSRMSTEQIKAAGDAFDAFGSWLMNPNVPDADIIAECKKRGMQPDVIKTVLVQRGAQRK